MNTVTLTPNKEEISYFKKGYLIKQSDWKKMKKTLKKMLTPKQFVELQVVHNFDILPIECKEISEWEKSQRKRK